MTEQAPPPPDPAKTLCAAPAELRNHSKLRRWIRLLRSPSFIVFFALLLRMGLLVGGHTYRRVPTTGPYGFADEMGRIAQSLAAGHGFSSPYGVPTGPTAIMPPVYPYLIAAAFRLWGINTPAAAFAVLMVNSLFSVLTCLLLLWLGRMTFGDTTGLLAAWAWAFLPGAVLIPISQIWYDALTAMLLAALVCATLRLRKAAATVSFRAWAAFGGLWALAALVNPTVLAPMPFLLAWVFYKRSKLGLVWGRPAAVLLAAFAIVLLPWLVRNLVVFRQPVFLRDGFGLQLYLGNHPGASGARTGEADPPDNPRELDLYRRAGEVAYMRAKQREALRFIASHPGEFLWLCLQRFGELWVWTGDYRPFGSVMSPALWSAPYFLLPALAMLGLALAFREQRDAVWPLAFVLLFYPLVFVISTMDPRYRHPIEPELALLGAYAVASLLRRFPHLTRRSAVAQRHWS